MYEPTYILLLLTEYVIVTGLLMLFLMKSREHEELHCYLLPVLLISSLGMLRLTGEAQMTSSQADLSCAFMYIILTASLTAMNVSGYTLPGCAGIISGALLFPAFGITFAPFIAAGAFLIEEKVKSIRSISLILNTLCAAGAAVYSVIRLDASTAAVSHKYILVIVMCIAAAFYFTVKDSISFTPLALLPLIPLAAGVFFNAFPTTEMTLSASVAPLVLLLGASAASGRNKKMQSHAEDIVHNPAAYIVLVIFILRTSATGFYSPGFLRKHM